MANFPYPAAVYRFFTEFSAIPHGSGNTAGIRAWALRTAAAYGIEAEADAAGNVILHKPASEGYAAHPGVILQGHLDMVCAKLPDCAKDMEKEGPDLVWSEEYLSANGTTLGGDDGIAIAYAFAVLTDDTLCHPPLTVILTVDEETGMDGASALSPDVLTGTYLLNIDSEEEGVFTVGCAGGVRVHLTYPAETEPVFGTPVKLTLSGLTGGHSGTEIHKALLNANTAMLRLLRSTDIPFALCAWQGGVRDNVIPTECTAEMVVSAGDVQQLSENIRCAFEIIKAEYLGETGIRLQMITEAEREQPALCRDAAGLLLDQLSHLPNGVQQTDPVLHMPQTSLNLGIFSLNGDGSGMQVDALIRSGIDAEKEALARKLSRYAEEAGGSASRSGNYPAWEYVPGTQLEQKAKAVFIEKYGREPVIETIHAGLECGILAAKAPQLQCISIGPDLFDIHTPRERLSLASAARTWEFLCALLAAL